MPLNEVKKMTQKQYYARGCTALLDAMGGAIHHIGNVHKYSKEEIGKTLFIIITDGLENSSKRYTYVTIKQMVERQKEKYGWEFIFIGANMDVIQEANKFGIDQAVQKILLKCEQQLAMQKNHFQMTGHIKLEKIIIKENEKKGSIDPF